MSREVRKVPADWQHPKYSEDEISVEPHLRDRFRPMLDESHADAVERWLHEDLPEWVAGERLWRLEGRVSTHRGIETIAEVVARAEEYRRPKIPTYQWWAGECPQFPDPSDYMPQWPDEQRTHYMMYEDTSEGTPISPAFETPEELARWLVDNEASAFAGQTASYEAWLRVAKGGFAPSAVMTNGEMVSGVEAMAGAAK